MTIRTKFLFLIFLMLFCFVTVISLNYFYKEQRGRLLNVQKEGLMSIGHIQKINVASKELLYSDYLDSAYDVWKKDSIFGEQKISDFLNSKSLVKMTKGNKDILNNYNTAVMTWGTIKGDLSGISPQIEAILKNDKMIKKGIFYLSNDYKGDYELFQIYSNLNKVGQKLNQIFLQTFESLINNVNSEISRLDGIYNVIVIVLSVLIIVVLLLIFVNFTRSLDKRFKSIGSIMKSVSERDFNVNTEIKFTDEIGKFANYIRDSLIKLKDVFNKIKNVSFKNNNLSEEVTRELNRSTVSLFEIANSIKEIKSEYENFNNSIILLSNSSAQIQDNINLLANQIDTQASTVIESSSSIEEIIASINNIAIVTKKRKEAALILAEAVSEGDKDINDSNTYIQEMTKSIQNIQDILSIIKAVAAQTNLLSMNASIEAAHAGEAGHGFSVVADEIRNLSDSTNNNSKNIEKSVRNIITLIGKNSELSKKNLEVYKTINTEVNDFVRLFEEITNGLDQMSIGSKEILEVNKILNNLTSDVKSHYNDLIKENQFIGNAISNLNGISLMIFRNISGINDKIDDILNITNLILDKQNESNSSMNTINEELSMFKT